MAQPSPLQHCIQALQADPDGYEANRNLGLEMVGTSSLTLPAEKHLLKALSFEPDGADGERLLGALAKVRQYQGDYDAAIGLFRQLFNRRPDSLQYLPELGNAYFLAGRMAEAADVYRVVLGVCHDRARGDAARRSGPPTQLISPSTVICSRFGEMAEKLDIHVKARMLGLTPEVAAVLLAPHALVINRCLMDCWRKAIGRYVTIVSDNQEIAEFERTYADSPLFVDFLAVPDGRVLNRLPAYYIIQRQWETEGRPPLLGLGDTHRRRGRRTLAALGMPEDAWFVSLHVREAGYHLEAAPWDHNALRNARIEDYFPAIEAVTARGGWVVRIGDASMSPLPPMERVIDYVHSGVRADWMDVFLCAGCRFLVGTTSGPYAVAFVFGVPVVGTNWFPLGYWPYSTRDIFVHKLLRRKGDGRFLDIRRSVRPPLAGMHWPSYFEANGLEVVDNSADDITDAVVEMLDRFDGAVEYSAGDQRMQQEFKAMADFADFGVNARVAAGFLRRHRFLIDAPGGSGPP